MTDWSSAKGFSTGDGSPAAGHRRKHQAVAGQPVDEAVIDHLREAEAGQNGFDPLAQLQPGGRGRLPTAWQGRWSEWCRNPRAVPPLP